jgi:hypothetical protein
VSPELEGYLPEGRTMRVILICFCWVICCTVGCNAGSTTPTQEYSAFVPMPGASFASALNDGDMSLWFSPQKYGVEIQGLSIKNILAPEGSEVSVSNPSSAKGQQWMILTVHSVNNAKTDWHIAWDIYQGQNCKQTIRAIITPPPEVKIMIDGRDVATSRR